MGTATGLPATPTWRASAQRASLANNQGGRWGGEQEMHAIDRCFKLHVLVLGDGNSYNLLVCKADGTAMPMAENLESQQAQERQGHCCNIFTLA